MSPGDGGDAANNLWTFADNFVGDTAPTYNNTLDFVYGAVGADYTSFDVRLQSLKTIRSLTYNDNADTDFATNLTNNPVNTGVNLVFDADAGNASINITSGAAGNFIIGTGGTAGTYGAIRLNDDLDIDHNGSGTLTFNRGILSTTSAITKTGTGTLVIEANNLASGGLNIEGGAVELVNAGSLDSRAGSAATLNLGAASGTEAATLHLGADGTELTKNINVVSGSSGTKTLQTVNSGNTNIAVSGNITLNAGLTVDGVTANRVTSLTGVISGANTLDLNAGNTTSNRIQVSGANTGLSGDTFITRGMIMAANDDAFGTGTVRIGGSASPIFANLAIANDVTISNDIIVAAGAGDRRLSNSQFATDADGITVDSNINLAQDLQLEADGVASGGDAITLAGIVSGAGGLRINAASVDSIGLSGVNTYEGDTNIETGTTLNLNDNAALTFYIGADGVNNQVAGDGTANFAGDFIFDLTSAAAAGTWTIIGSGISETFDSTFTVAGFTDNLDGTWSSGSYTFNESDGTLSAVPEPGTFALLGGLFALGWVMLRRRR
jgi:autotransporter-associated beta strand protein